jgi:hypothetical protein
MNTKNVAVVEEKKSDLGQRTNRIETFQHTETFAPDGRGFNEPPVNLRIITSDEFAEKISKNVLLGQEYRQVWNNFDTMSPEIPKLFDNRAFPLHIFWFHDKTGVAVASLYKGKWVDGRNIGKTEGYYFAVGCNHEWKELSYIECAEKGIYHGGQCYHVAQCQKCKIAEGHDSSD